MPVKTKPSIEDVARHAGVSTATVSRSLNEPSKVKRATLETVRGAVQALGYAPHFGGRALASNKSNTVGALIPTMDNAMFARGLQALEETLAGAGVTLLIATTSYDADREFDQIQSLLGRGIDGILLIGLERPESTYALLKQHGVPVVVAWSFKQDSEHICVGFDNLKAAADQTNSVLDHGHRYIGMIAGITQGNDRAADRQEGVYRALRARNLELSADHLVESPYHLNEAAHAMEKLMALDPRPTAVICGNDVLAAGALKYANRVGIAVPADVSIVGFDDIDLASVTTPPLTTVRVPHVQMGQAAARLLLALGEGARDLESIKFEPELVVRGSLAEPRNAQRC